MFRFRYTGIEWLLTVSRGWQLSFELTQSQSAGGDLDANLPTTDFPSLKIPNRPMKAARRWNQRFQVRKSRRLQPLRGWMESRSASRTIQIWCPIKWLSSHLRRRSLLRLLGASRRFWPICGAPLLKEGQRCREISRVILSSFRGCCPNHGHACAAVLRRP